MIKTFRNEFLFKKYILHKYLKNKQHTNIVIVSDIAQDTRYYKYYSQSAL